MIKTKTYLKQLYKKNLALLVITTIISILQAILLVTFALATRQLLDGEKDFLINNALYLAMNILLVITLNALNQYLQQKNSVKYEQHLKEELYASIFRKDYQSITALHSGNLMNYLTSDVQIIASSLATIIPNACLLITRLICAFIIVSYFLPYLGLYFAGLGIITFSFSFSFRKKLKMLHKIVQEKDGIARAYMQESIESILVIKSFSGDEKTFKKAKYYIDQLSKAKLIKAKFATFINVCIHLIFQLSYVITLIYAVWSMQNVENNIISYGTILALIQLVGQIQTPITNLAGIMPKYYAMVSSCERLVSILNIEEETMNKEITIDFDEIVVANISFGYGEKQVIKSSTVSIAKGDFILIKGTSGIGKSTFLKLLLALYKLDDGSIVIKNKNASVNASRDTRRLFSYVPQGNFIFSGTIKENLCFFKDSITEDEINKALKISEATDFIDELEEGLNTIIGEKGLGLSEGQIQRLAIARAIISDAPVILLDEATSALDKDTELKVLNNLKELKDKTCIIVTHKDASKLICNKEFVFDETFITEHSL